VYGDNVRDDLNFLVNTPKSSLGSAYHDAGRCWTLIDAAVKEIRRLRRQLEKHRSQPSRRKQ
jgi:hypothetical protein